MEYISSKAEYELIGAEVDLFYVYVDIDYEEKVYRQQFVSKHRESPDREGEYSSLPPGLPLEDEVQITNYATDLACKINKEFWAAQKHLEILEGLVGLRFSDDEE